MNNPPPLLPLAPIPPRPQPKPERGGFLTIVLGIRLVADGFAILGSLGAMRLLSTAAESGTRLGSEGRAAGNFVTLLLVIACIDLAGVAGVFSWRKWGVYILGGCEALGFIIRIQAGQTGMLLVGMGTILAAGFAIAMRWRYFE